MITAFCSARLRDSRIGRAWIAIREDETSGPRWACPMRTKTWSYATGAFFGGVAGAFYASYKSGAFPDDFFFQISSSSSAWSSSGAWEHLGVIFGACFLAYLDREGLSNIGDQINSNLGTNIDGSEGRVRHLRRDHRDRDALPAGGADPELAGRRGAARGVHDEPLYDRGHAGA